jgi:hypothetical protein
VSSSLTTDFLVAQKYLPAYQALAFSGRVYDSKQAPSTRCQKSRLSPTEVGNSPPSIAMDGQLLHDQCASVFTTLENFKHPTTTTLFPSHTARQSETTFNKTCGTSHSSSVVPVSAFHIELSNRTRFRSVSRTHLTRPTCLKTSSAYPTMLTGS